MIAILVAQLLKKNLNIMVMFNVVVDMVCSYNIKVYSLVMHPTIALQKKHEFITHLYPFNFTF